MGNTSTETCGDAIGRLLHWAMKCDVTSWIDLDLDLASAHLATWAGAATSPVRDYRPVDRARAGNLAARLAALPDVMVMRPADAEVAGIRYQLAIGLHFDAGLAAWLLAWTSHGFSTDDVAHAGLLAPGLMRRFDEGDHPGIGQRVLPESVQRSRLGVAGLTSREREVLRLVGRGLTSRAVGRQIGISERTVAKHLEHAYAKLGCRDRLSAVLRLRDAAY